MIACVKKPLIAVSVFQTKTINQVSLGSDDLNKKPIDKPRKIPLTNKTKCHLIGIDLNDLQNWLVIIKNQFGFK